MALPIAVGTFSWVAMMFVDTMFVGWLGESQLAAVGSAGMWSYIAACFLIGLVSCVSTFVAQSIGRGRPEDSARYTWQGIHICIGSIGIAAILYPLAGPLFQLMPHSPDVTRFETEYFEIRLAGYALLIGQFNLSAFFWAVNRPSIPTIVSFFAVAVNVVLDYGLIFGKFGMPELGIAGAAWATVIAQLLLFSILFGVFLSREFHAEYRTRIAYALDWHKLGELIRIGAPAGLFSLLEITTWGVFSSFIVGYFGDKVLAAHNVAIVLMHASFMAAVALNQAIAPIVGKYIGMKEPERAKARGYTATRIASAYMLTIGLIFAIFGEWIISWFNTDPEVIRTGHTLLILAAVFQGFDAITIVLSGALRGAGDTRWMTVVTGLTSYLIFLPAACLLAFGLNLGAVGAWAGATIYIITLSGLMLWRWHAERWRSIRIFRDEPPSEASLSPSPRTETGDLTEIK